ncbi:MAG TPA: DUF29 domain-containing protein [Geminicoccaceae bacterium]|nr:DUF29 domain-containing protein [Geminicoccaceae bacterium]
MIETKRVRYEEDLYAWTQEQAALLRARQVNALDWENLAEEIAAVGGSDRRKVESRLCVILLHLLKWQAQPALRGASWRKTLRTQRREIRKLLQQSPSLRRQVPDLIRDAYPDAVNETGLPAEHFPGSCPYAPDDVLDEDHLPEASL